MRITTSYKVRIKQYNHIFDETVAIYRSAVRFFLGVCDAEWDASGMQGMMAKERCNRIERLTHGTKKNPNPKHTFDVPGTAFYKMPSYMRRAAISEAAGLYKSYRSNLKNWQSTPKGRKPTLPKDMLHSMPTLYRDNCYVRTGEYAAEIKVFVRNTWDWLHIDLRKSDVDYITAHCFDREESAPTLKRIGKRWYLVFAYEKKGIALTDIDMSNAIVMGVDLGINNACTCSIMDTSGTILKREFLALEKEKDCLYRAINRIKKAQQHWNLKTPRLWAVANGINDDIAVKTAQFIVKTAADNGVYVIVMEHLELTGKKTGSKKQRLHIWKARYVQSMVADKAHQLGIRVSTVNAWGTSRLAFDGSGKVERGTYMQNGEERYNYSICVFPTGKVYNCDLNASYNIGARYCIREILKSVPETARLAIEAKVPQCAKRSTCTLSTLISVNAALKASSFAVC